MFVNDDGCHQQCGRESARSESVSVSTEFKSVLNSLFTMQAPVLKVV